MFLPSLSNIATEFQVDYSLVSLAVAGYLGITAVLQLIFGPLSDRLGRRRVLLVGVAIFVVASIGCLLATDIWVFLFFRVMQGAITVGWVLSLAIIRDISSEQQAASKIGYVSMAMAVAPMLGPIMGGVLDELFGWRSSFLFYLVLGVTAFGLCWFDLGETNRNPSESFTKQFRAYPELFRSRRFWGYAICVMFSTSAFYTFLAGVPMVAGSILKLAPSALGFYMGSITAGFFIGSFLSGRYSKRYPLTTMMIVGRVSVCSGLIVGLILVAAGNINVLSIFGATIFVGLGNGLTMPSANAGAMSVRSGLAGSASGLIGALTVAGGAMLTFITGMILTEKYAVFQLLGVMLFCSLMGLFAALYVLHINKQESTYLRP